MAARIIVGGLAIARLALAAVNASSHPHDPIPTHAVQFDLNLVGEEFEKAGFGSTIEPTEPLPPVDGYTGPIVYGNVAINAPFNCLGQNTHEGNKVWLDGLFDPNRCADACKHKTEWNPVYGLQDRVCRFFNTYILERNGVAFAQYCSLYTQLWDSRFATKTGEISRDGFNYTISASFGYYNGTDRGPCQGRSSPRTSPCRAPTTFSTTTSSKRSTRRCTTAAATTSSATRSTHPTRPLTTSSTARTSTHPSTTYH